MRWLPDLQGLNIDRDLVFIEQRGTRQSSLLNCPASSLPLAGTAALRASVQSCLARLHADLRFYTTAMFTDDVSQILTDLHYAKANLFGGSYGATAEQVFLLRHPGQVRTMSLESGTLLTTPIYEREAGNSQLALEYVFARCDADPACHQAFPHLAADWAALWASLGKSPWAVPAAQSPIGKPLTLDQDTIAAGIYQALETSDIGPIPVRFVVFPATGPDKAPDPVVYFAGGPGVSAIADIPVWLPVRGDFFVAGVTGKSILVIRG